MFYATKDSITKEINKNDKELYQKLGWTITQSGEEKYDPYDYQDVEKSGNCLQAITINGETFIGYSSFYCINTKTYVEEPSRTIDGSIPNINDYDTFIVPRVKISFDYMTITDFRRFLKAITPNEFNVTYYDYELDTMVSYKMYCEPREMAKIFNRGYEILAVTGIEISLIATLNDIDYLTIQYYDGTTLINTKEMIFGNTYSIYDSEDYNKTDSSGNKLKFSHWNTRSDGYGIRYLANEVITATNNIKLYGFWK